jgi:hypothetical protein
VLLISKNKISIFLLAFLFIGGLGFVSEDAFGAATTFVAIHNSTTTTEIIFSQTINGTLNNQNWYVGLTMATGATNGTTPSATGNNYAATTDGFLNNTSRIMLTHAALNGTGAGAIADVRYIVSGAVGVAGTNADIPAANLGNLGRGGYSGSVAGGTQAYNILANNTAAIDVRDGIAPGVVSAKKTGQKSIEVTMNEPVGNQNVTGSHFTLYGTLDSVVSNVVANNGTSTLLLTTKNIINDFDTVTLSFTASPNVYFLTDATNSPYHGGEGHNGTAYGAVYTGSGLASGILAGGDDGKTELGNNLLNFTGLIVTIPNESTDNASRIPPHLHDEITISVNSDKLFN